MPETRLTRSAALAGPGSPGVASAVGLGHASPDSVRFVRCEGVVAALGDDRAVFADLPGVRLAAGPGTTAFAIGGEEHR